MASGFVLTNYWFLIGWVAIMGVVSFVIPYRRPERIMGRIEYRWPIPMALLAIVPLIIWAGTRTDAFGDTGVYRSTFLEAPDQFSKWSEYISGINKDKGYYTMMVWVKSLIGNHDVIYFLLIAAVQLLCIFLIYRYLSEDFLLTLFFFVASTDYMSWCWNGLRQMLAASCIFACAVLMIKRKIVPVIVVIIVFSLFHQSALIMIPAVLISQGKAWNKRTVFYMILIVLAVVFLGRFTDFLDTAVSGTQYANITTDEIWINDDGTNPIRALVYSVPAILSLVGKRYIDEANDPVINFSVNMSIMAAGIYLVSVFTSGIYIGRLPIYMSLFSYISLPWLLRHMFTRESRWLVYVLAIGLYLLFFYYQTHVEWGMT